MLRSIFYAQIKLTSNFPVLDVAANSVFYNKVKFTKGLAGIPYLQILDEELVAIIMLKPITDKWYPCL